MNDEGAATMMDGKDVYRERLAACLAAAEASFLPQVRARHLTAARSWQALLDTVLDREANVSAHQHDASLKKTTEEDASGEADVGTPAPLDDAVEGGTTAVEAFRSSVGR